MRLIDADALFDWGKHKLSDATKYGNKGADQTHFSYSTLMMYEIADEINGAPTINAVLVVHCGECIHKKYCKQFVCDMADADCVKPITSCSYGKRKEQP